MNLMSHSIYIVFLFTKIPSKKEDVQKMARFQPMWDFLKKERNVTFRMSG